MIRDDLAALLQAAASAAGAAGELPELSLPEGAVDRPQNPERGDYASSAALKLARAARMSPLNIAETLVRHLPPSELVADVSVAAPGFVNFRLRESWLQQQANAIVEAGTQFGETKIGDGETVQIEFVSGNPTGPLHVGHGRGAVLGSALANVLESAGYRVQREYYLNDQGTQIDAFARTLNARYQEALGRPTPVPEDGYKGAYMQDLAREIIASEGDRFLKMSDAEATRELGEIGLQRMVAQIQAVLDRLGVRFDRWFSERSLFQSGDYDETLRLLGERGYVEEREGAVWFTSTALGEDKDNVIVRSNGQPTYFASDIAYHRDKFGTRKFDRVIDIWGADHQGHVSRMKAVMAALGFDPERLVILISQIVTLKRAGEVLRLSKRTGEIITLDELIDEVGADACRYFFLSRSADSQMDFDLELAKEQSDKNPVYYIQYAHARIASILRRAAETGHSDAGADVSLLAHSAELALLREMLRLPEVVETAALGLAPQLLPYYASELAASFHVFYRECRVVTDDEPLTRARLRLVGATQITLANALRMMGMSAPDRM